MRRDPTQFRERFKAYLSGKMPYKAGRILPEFEGGTTPYRYILTDDGWTRVPDQGSVLRAFEGVTVTPSGNIRRYVPKVDNSPKGIKEEEWRLAHTDLFGNPTIIDRPLEDVSPEFFLLSSGLGSLGKVGIRKAASLATKTAHYATTGLYSLNPIINLYATAARRYNLPDKARIPYLIRKFKDPIVETGGGEINLSGNRWNHINATYDRPVVSHKSSWDIDDTMLFNGKSIIDRGLLRSIEPSDVFTKETATKISIPKKDVGVVITGNPETVLRMESLGIPTRTTQRLQEMKNAAHKATERNREFAQTVQKIQSKYGRPKVKDIRLLEKRTGLDSYITPTEDLPKFRSFEDLVSSKRITMKLAENPPVYGNYRPMSYHKTNYGINDSYNNFMYDPTTNAEAHFNFATDTYYPDYFPLNPNYNPTLR